MKGVGLMAMRYVRPYEADLVTKYDFAELRRETKEDLRAAVDRLELKFDSKLDAAINSLKETIDKSETRLANDRDAAEKRLADDRDAAEKRLENERKESRSLRTQMMIMQIGTLGVAISIFVAIMLNLN